MEPSLLTKEKLPTPHPPVSLSRNWTKSKLRNQTIPPPFRPTPTIRCPPRRSTPCSQTVLTPLRQESQASRGRLSRWHGTKPTPPSHTSSMHAFVLDITPHSGAKQ